MEYGPAVSKLVTDLEYMPQLVTTNCLSYLAVCLGCGHVEEPADPEIPGTGIGANLASVITALYAMPGSLSSIRTALEEIFDIRI